MNQLKKLVHRITDIQNEEDNLVRFVYQLHLTSSHKLLDIGCGYGKKLYLLQRFGIQMLGIDINSALIETNRQAGLPCMTVEEFQQTTELYDILLMSHVIEHFAPNELLKFLDEYLYRLKDGGYLLITTPLLSTYFYDDFDHVRPYQPTGLGMVFGFGTAQVKYYGHHHLELVDIWFRRGPFQLRYVEGLYLRKYSRWPQLVNIFLSLLYHISFGLIGQTHGWMGLYRKV